MSIPTYLCKQKALAAIKGNWQTAMLVSFFASILDIVYNLVLSEIRVDTSSYQAMLDSLQLSIASIPIGLWSLGGILALLNLLLTPTLLLSRNHYFICRLKGEELGFRGLFSRIRIWRKALLLYLFTSLKILLWSFLFIVPGIIAAFRYSQAFYYLAEEPSLSVVEAVEKSKKTMGNLKMNYLLLDLSFLAWSMAPIVVQLTLWSINPILALVVYQGVNLAINTYKNGAFAVFFITASAQTRQCI